ncbi:MAG TPA: PhzF family phenazine biosynthesis protein, partial [Chthoniobacterales bacterium]
MKNLHYHLLDVFTDRAFGGNPLAVFLDGRGIGDAMMQSIAKELNLSETTFVLPPADAANDYRVRIFTPASELPMAGHPTVGTAFVLAQAGMVKGAAVKTIVFEEGVGPVPVTIAWKNGAPDFIEMQQPLPAFGPRIEDVESVAQMLSLDAGDIRETNLPVEVVSCGVPFLFVPVRNLEAMRRIRFRMDVWERALQEAPAQIFAFTREVQFADSQVHSRMFAPALGVAEDPA